MSSSGASKLYQEFQQAAQSVALNITKPTDRPVPKALSAISPCPRHCQVFDFSATSTKEINKLPFKCPPPLPPKRDSTSSLPPLPLRDTRPNTCQKFTSIRPLKYLRRNDNDQTISNQGTSSNHHCLWVPAGPHVPHVLCPDQQQSPHPKPSQHVFRAITKQDLFGT